MSKLWLLAGSRRKQVAFEIDSLHLALETYQFPETRLGLLVYSMNSLVDSLLLFFQHLRIRTLLKTSEDLVEETDAGQQADGNRAGQHGARRKATGLTYIIIFSGKRSGHCGGCNGQGEVLDSMGVSLLRLAPSLEAGSARHVTGCGLSSDAPLILMMSISRPDTSLTLTYLHRLQLPVSLPGFLPS